MALESAPIRFYGSPTDKPPLEWDDVEAQLGSAPTFWVVAASGDDRPHPRPVWGVWSPLGDADLWLTLGSPRLAADVAARPLVTAHLDSGVEVVIVEGAAELVRDPAAVARFVAAYDRKYDWVYDVEQYGPPTRITPTSVLAWRSAGWAGRDGFAAASKWTSA
jgi:hypothetical protein